MYRLEDPGSHLTLVWKLCVCVRVHCSPGTQGEHCTGHPAHMRTQLKHKVGDHRGPVGSPFPPGELEDCRLTAEPDVVEATAHTAPSHCPQVSANGNVLRSEIVGSIKMRVFLSGMPELRLGLNDKVLFDNTGREYLRTALRQRLAQSCSREVTSLDPKLELSACLLVGQPVAFKYQG